MPGRDAEYRRAQHKKIYGKEEDKPCPVQEKVVKKSSVRKPRRKGKSNAS